MVTKETQNTGKEVVQSLHPWCSGSSPALLKSLCFQNRIKTRWKQSVKSHHPPKTLSFITTTSNTFGTALATLDDYDRHQQCICQNSCGWISKIINNGVRVPGQEADVGDPSGANPEGPSQHGKKGKNLIYGFTNLPRQWSWKGYRFWIVPIINACPRYGKVKLL